MSPTQVVARSTTLIKGGGGGKTKGKKLNPKGLRICPSRTQGLREGDSRIPNRVKVEDSAKGKINNMAYNRGLTDLNN